MRKTNSELSANSQSAKSQLSLRKRIKETLAMALSLLMVFGVVGIPLRADAEYYEFGDLATGYYMPGDTFGAQSGPKMIKYSFYSDEETMVTLSSVGGKDVPSDYGTFTEGGVFTLPSESLKPKTVAGKTMPVIYNLYSTQTRTVQDPDFGYDLDGKICLFEQYNGFKASYAGDTTTEQYCRFYGSGQMYWTGGSAPEPGDGYLGWSPNKDYIDSDSDGVLYRTENEIVAEDVIGYVDVSTATLTLYPIQDVVETSLEISMNSYVLEEDGTAPEDAAPVITSNLPEDYFTFEYIQIINGTPASTSSTLPTVPGVYSLQVSTEGLAASEVEDDGTITKRGHTAKSASADFIVYGSEGEIVTPYTDLFYTGSPQELVSYDKESFEGIVTFSDTKEGTYTDTIPTGTNAGTYTVWYMIGDGEPEKLEIEIYEASPDLVEEPKAVENLRYTGSLQDLIMAGQAENGTMLYALGTPENYSESIPQAKERGTYTVYYMVKGDENYSDIEAPEELKLEVSIDEVASATVNALELEYSGEDQPLFSVSDEVGGKVIFMDPETEEDLEGIPTGKNAGEYTYLYRVDIGDEEGNNYITSDPVSITATIKKAKITVTAPVAKELTYNGEYQQVIEAGSTPAGHLLYNLENNGEGSVSIPTIKNAGTYKVWYFVGFDSEEESNNYEVDEAAYVEVTIGLAKGVADGAEAAANLEYDGTEQELIVLGDDAVLEDAPDAKLTFSFDKNGTYSDSIPKKKDAGAYTVYVKRTGDGKNYEESDVVSFTVTIAPKEIGIRWSNTSFEYDGQTHIPGATATGLVTGDTCTLTVEGGQVNAGTYEAEVTALSNTNYKLPENVTVSFTIAPRVVVLSWSDTEFTYDGEQHVATAVVSNLLEGDTCSVTVSGGKTDAGTYTATATELSNGNYALPDEVTASFSIAGKTVGFVWANTSFVYDGEEHCPTVTVTGLVGNDTCTATVTGAAITAGTHTATVTALSNPNYILPEEVTTEFTIEKTGTVITKDPAAITGLIYNGTAQTLVEAGEVEGGKLQYCLTIGGEYKDEIPTATDAKKYTVYYKAVATDGNYQSDGSKIFSVEVTISQKTVGIEWENKAFIYNKEEQLPQAVATGLIEGDVCTTTVEGAQVNAGTYTATVTALSNANYKLPEDASATFTIQPVEATLQWERIEFYYDGKEHCITANVSNLLDGDSCTVTVTGGGINAGTYTATAVALSNPNYALPESVTEEFSINPKDIFITKEPAGKTLSYTGSEQELIVAGTATEGGKVVYRLQGAENFSDSIPIGKEIGEYRIQYTVESVDTNHSGGSQGGELTVVIAPKTLTLSWSDTEFTYDDKEHLPTASLNGVVEGEKVTVTVTGARKETGKYTATATFAGEDISNYKLPENTSVEYTIKQKEEPKKEKETGSASVTMGSFIYGGAATTPVVTSSTHDTSKASISYKASGAPDDAYTGTKPTGVGTYTVRAILPENDNYKQYVATGTFTISYLPVPEGSYEITGKQGVGGWFTSEVQLTPAAGYEISIGDRSSFKTSSVTLTEEMAGRTFYIRSTNTGEQTAGITIAAMQIDTDAPTIEMEENNVYFCDEEGKLLGMANDKNLDKVYVNGVEVEVTDGDGVKTFDLPVDRKKQSVNVKVVDKAGNEKSMVVITAPAWMKSGVVGEGEFYLEPKNRYGTPSDGTCTLEGDASTYMPGVKFFTKKEGFHTFHVQH